MPNDFERDKEIPRKWREENQNDIQDFKSKLSTEESRFLDKIQNKMDDISKQLRDLGKNEPSGELKLDVDRLDGIVEKGGQSSQGMTIYMDTRLPYKVNALAKGDSVPEHGYIKGRLDGGNPQAETTELIILNIPAGEKYAFLDATTDPDNDFELMFERNRTWKINDINPTVHNGRERTDIVADLLPKKDENNTEKVQETILEDIKVEEGASAVQNSGLVSAHVDAFKEVAAKFDTIILFRPVNKLSTSLIENGAATKGMNVHGKSSDWGPMAGYIPFDADLSKKHGDRKAVTKGNEDNEHSLRDNPGVIDKIQLSISDARIKELKDENIIKDTKPDNRYDVFDLNKNADVYEFRRERSSGKIEYKIKDGQQDWKPVEVMAKVIEGENKPLTADYDMFGLAPSLAEIKKIIPQKEWESAIQDRSPLKRLNNVTNLLIKYGLTRNPDPDKGKLTDWQKNRIDDLNKAAKDAGYTGGTVVNHGTEQDNTEFPEQDKEIFIITPDGKTVLTKSWDDTQKFIEKNIVNKGRLYYFNRSYNKIAGGNKAQIEWTDPIEEMKSYTIPTKNELIQDIYSIKSETGEFLPSETLSIALDEIGGILEKYYNPAIAMVEDESMNSKRSISLFYAFEALDKLQELRSRDNAIPNEKYKEYFDKLENRFRNQIELMKNRDNVTLTTEEISQQIGFNRINATNEQEIFELFQQIYSSK